MSVITINNISFDPEDKFFEGLKFISDHVENTNYILINVNKSLSNQELDELGNVVDQILEFVPENTYMCRLNDSNISQIENLPFVDSVHPYYKFFKIAEDIIRHDNESLFDFLKFGFIDYFRIGEPQTVDIWIHADAITNDVKQKIAQIVGLDINELDLTCDRLRAHLNFREIRRLAGVDEVRHIEKVYETGITNNRASKIIGLQDLAVSHPSLKGDGQIVTMCDTGLDKGLKTDIHSAFKNRVLKFYPLAKRKANDTDGHGTHVAGSILGNEEQVGSVKISGVAPKAKLIVQAVMDSSKELSGIPYCLYKLFEPPHQLHKSFIHNNSWTEVKNRAKYSSYSYDIDKYVWKNRSLVILFASGNQGSDNDKNGIVDPGTISAPGTAKNCITVGASENFRPEIKKMWSQFRFMRAPIQRDYIADHNGGMAATSGCGPTLDGRIKPDVVAPGTSILSALSREDSVIEDSWWGESDTSGYTFEGGTSMATAIVSGCVAIIRQSLIKAQHSNPSAALIKAMLINGAVSLDKKYVPHLEHDIPDYLQGFGLVNIEQSIESKIRILSDEDIVLEYNNEEVTQLIVPENSNALKVTLVWSDPPGNGLQNDLDLIVRNNGEERHGNMKPGSQEFDRKNNVEQVTWNGVSGTVDIIVKAHRIARFNQSFALVARFI